MLTSFCFFTSCQSNKLGSISGLANDWLGKEIVFPQNLVFSIRAIDTVDFCISNEKYKILSYVDSTGCFGCALQLEQWIRFIQSLGVVVDDKVQVVKFVHPRNVIDIKNELNNNNYIYPVCIDLNDDLNQLNKFPSDTRFHCFLLDENNKVILIGNPVQNPKIKELYIRTICERLGIDYNPQHTQDKSPEVNLGAFSISETKAATFPIHNSEQSDIVVDTLFTSCECTTAQINKNVIQPNETATLSVTYTPDGIGDFYREVYVKLKNKEKPLVFIIRGTVE